MKFFLLHMKFNAQNISSHFVESVQKHFSMFYDGYVGWWAYYDCDIKQYRSEILHIKTVLQD